MRHPIPPRLRANEKQPHARATRYKAEMLTLPCLCGQVCLAAPRPAFVHECNCTLCCGTGARWGYYHPSQVRVEGATQGWSRTDKGEASAVIRFCATCGTTTHFTLTDAAMARHGDTMLGVNLRLADEAALAGVELRYPDGAAWDGAGPFGYVRAAEVIGKGE